MSKNRTFSSGISQRYALALYELSKEKNATEEFASNMITFMKIFNTNEDLKNFVKNPTYSVENQKAVLSSEHYILGLQKQLETWLSHLKLSRKQKKNFREWDL